jgi:hypothetical protein
MGSSESKSFESSKGQTLGSKAKSQAKEEVYVVNFTETLLGLNVYENAQKQAEVIKY